MTSPNSKVLKSIQKIYDIPQCSICFNELTSGLATTKCGHIYHASCIIQALEVKTQCPMCRTRNQVCNLVSLLYDIKVTYKNPYKIGIR